MPPPFNVTFEAIGIACERGGRRLFSDLSFRLAPGDGLLVRGPNGAGKTSLIRQVAGLLPLAGGRFSTEGAEADIPLAELCHHVGHLNAVKSVLSVRENLTFWADFIGGEMGGETGREMGGQDVEEAMAVFGLTPLAAISADLLSAGQKRKLALSRLFCGPRPIWLLDEPSVSLDKASVKRLDQAIRDHQKQGGIAVVSTHVPLGTAFTHTLTLGRTTTLESAA